MEITELSLAPNRKFIVERRSNSSSSESEHNNISTSSKKRKLSSSEDEHHHMLNPFTSTGPPIHTSVDLHVKDPLPLDWEQCLDLESGRMYYLNRKTLKKSWKWPKDRKLDLELNISTISDSGSSNSSSLLVEDSKQEHQLVSSSSNTVALACFNCHLLVILSRSSPSCPNCKYVHSIPITHQPQLPKISPKSLNTLSLLN